jgi:acetylornithine deacetylase/succinyl-diaminopimelate desuccinylase-like protein
VQALKRQGVPHPRIVGLIETCEESGSRDLLPYIDALRPRLGDVAWWSAWTRAPATTTSCG